MSGRTYKKQLITDNSGRNWMTARVKKDFLNLQFEFLKSFNKKK